MLNNLNKAIALSNQKNKKSGYKDAKAYIDNLISVNHAGEKKQYAVNETETRFIQGKITKSEYDKLIKYIDKNM